MRIVNKNIRKKTSLNLFEAEKIRFSSAYRQTDGQTNKVNYGLSTGIEVWTTYFLKLTNLFYLFILYMLRILDWP